MQYENIQQFGNRKIPAKMTMFNLKKQGNSTTMEYKKAKFDMKINKKKFSFRELERGN